MCRADELLHSARLSVYLSVRAYDILKIGITSKLQIYWRHNAGYSNCDSHKFND